MFLSSRSKSNRSNRYDALSVNQSMYSSSMKEIFSSPTSSISSSSTNVSASPTSPTYKPRIEIYRNQDINSSPTVVKPSVKVHSKIFNIGRKSLTSPFGTKQNQQQQQQQQQTREMRRNSESTRHLYGLDEDPRESAQKAMKAINSASSTVVLVESTRQQKSTSIFSPRSKSIAFYKSVSIELNGTSAVHGNSNHYNNDDDNKQSHDQMKMLIEIKEQTTLQTGTSEAIGQVHISIHDKDENSRRSISSVNTMNTDITIDTSRTIESDDTDSDEDDE